MPNQLSPQLVAQLFAQRSGDPFLALLTLTHPSFSQPIYLVNNTEDIVSNGNTFVAFPFKFILPSDDAESTRELSLEFDNVSLELLDEIRSVTTSISLKLEMVLASIPDEIQYEFSELKISNITYNKNRISAKVFLDVFLSSEIPSEKYLPSNFPGLF